MGIGWEPAKYRETNKFLEGLNINISYVDAPGIPGAPISFSYRAMRGEYCIYIDRKVDRRTFMARDLCEKGHILYNHFNRPRAHRRQFEEFFRRHLQEFMTRLPLEGNPGMWSQRFGAPIHTSSAASPLGMYSAYIYHRFSDIAQAMEIGTKLFEADREMQSDVPGGPLEGFIFPQKGWPKGLDWMSYLSFLCADLNLFLDLIANGSGEKIKPSDVTNYNAKHAVERRIQDMQETRQTTADAESNAAYEPDIIRHGRIDNYTDTRTSNTVTELHDIKDLARILMERSFLLKRNRLHTDMLYHFNRNRFGDILIPRRYRIENYSLNNLCILLDVSGSVPETILRRVTRTIIRSQGAFNKNASRLVCWSDKLRSDTSLGDISASGRCGAISPGGGTVLGAGIEYCKQYLNRESGVIIISDFQDNLNDWIAAAQNLDCKKTAVGYGRLSRETSVEQWFSVIGSGADYRKTPVDIRRFLSVFDTVLLRTDEAPPIS
jgi:hypothetical protein